MELHIVIEGKKALTQQLYQQLREGIESGRLGPGTQLPPTRLLAEQLGVSRKTVAEAYNRLTYDNLLSGRVGVGTFINTRIPRQQPGLSESELASASVVEQWRGRYSPLTHHGEQPALRFEFHGGTPASNLFPHEEWRRCILFALRQTSRSRGLYNQPEGLLELRRGIARHVAFSRGVRCVEDDVVITSGAQQALDLISRVLIEPGCLVAMEEPGYPPARLLFTAQGARVTGVPVDEQGIRSELIPDGTRLIYVTPSHQFPLGMPMSVARRKALLARARELGAIIIEDDYDSEFRYEGRPADSLQSMDSQGVVAYIGTFSKSLLPELRMGYAVLPPAILKAVCIAKRLSDWHTATFTQWALAKFINEGYLLKHIRRCHEVYANRRERILARLNGDLSQWFEPFPSNAGIHLAVSCTVAVDIPLLVERARRAGIGLYSLAPCYHNSDPIQGLLIGYGTIETLDIDPALDGVRDILMQMT
jgi:GntR family transcriptional regulator/MocR family aminotransferase